MSKILAHMQSLPYSNLSLCCIYYTGLDRQTSKKYVNTDCTLRRLVIWEGRYNQARYHSTRWKRRELPTSFR